MCGVEVRVEPVMRLYSRTTPLFSLFFVYIFLLQANINANIHNNRLNNDSPCSSELADISVFQGDKLYTKVSQTNNPAYSHNLPAFVVLPRTVEDVQRALSCAMAKSVPFTVKNGGHSAVGFSTIDGTKNGGFVLYLSQMNNTQLILPNIAKIQAGAIWKNVYSVVKATDYVIVGGGCPTVGISGYTLGGGMSYLSRKYGLAIDNVLSFTMVTANGSNVVIANSTVNSDLYWGLRGGGGGNFGVVVDITFQLQPSFDTYIYGEMTFPNTKGADDHRVEALAIMGSSEFSSDLIFDASIGEDQTFHLQYFHFGSEIEKTTEQLLDKLGSFAKSHIVKPFSSYWELRDYYASTHLPAKAVEAHPFIHMACMFEAISMKVAQMLLNKPVLPNCAHFIIHLGGKVASYKSNETAYPHRNAQFEIYSACFYTDKDEEHIGSGYLDTLYNLLGKHCIGNYINDMQLNLHDWQTKYYGENYPRLLDIQNKWNSLNKGTYHFLMGIGSNYTPKDDIPSSPPYHSEF